MAEVRLENVTKLYGRYMAINNMNFNCKEGEFLSIVGPTGAGKTTTLKMIAGIENVSSGTIYFNERPVNQLAPQERDVAMVFETYNLYPHLTVYDNVAFPLRAPGRKDKVSPEEERRRVTAIADSLGIMGLLDRMPQQLSGGQMQRVSLARALVRKAQVYLLDEPIAHLDARLRFSTQTILKEIAREIGSTTIYVTHDYREALALSDRMAVLRKGTIEQIGTPEEVYDSPATDFVGRFVGEPPINLIDGEVVTKDNKTFLAVEDGFAVQIPDELVGSMKSLAWEEGGKLMARLGIRCDNIRIAEERYRSTLSNYRYLQLRARLIPLCLPSSCMTFSFMQGQEKASAMVCLTRCGLILTRIKYYSSKRQWICPKHRG